MEKQNKTLSVPKVTGKEKILNHYWNPRRKIISLAVCFPKSTGNCKVLLSTFHYNEARELQH